MFKDTDQELARLEAELLKEEETDEFYPEETEDYDPEEENFYPEEEPEAEPVEYDYEDTRAADGPAVYQNYSNDYGRNLRNFASGYRAYNSDECDEDLDAFSEDVYDAQPESGNHGLLITACILAAILGGVVLYLLLHMRGIL